MKKILLALSFIALTSHSNALIRTVSNNVNSPGQFTTFAAAMTAANAGDSIYVVGSPISYGNITIEKPVTVIGSGYNPDVQNPNKTEFGVITCARTSSLNPSGSVFIGIKFSNITLSGLNATTVLSNITIRRCYGQIFSASFVTSVLAYNNIITYYSVAGTTGNYSVYNNIITNALSGSGTAFLGTINVYNNVFHSGNNSAALSSVYNTNFYNNIFYGSSPVSPSGSNTFYNNLSYGSPTFTFNTSGSNSGANNQADVNPLFVNNNYQAPYASGFDYHLGAGSPGIGAAFGGGEIGIYGGSFPFPSGGVSLSGFQTSAVAPIPQIYEMNMANPMVPTTSTLNVQVKVRKVD